MRGAVIKWLAGGAALGVVALVALWWSCRETHPEMERPSPAAPPVFNPASQTHHRLSPVEARSGLADLLPSAVANLKAAETADQKGATLSHLRQALTGVSTNEASALIRRFLDTRADAPTGRGFKIGGQGILAESPTLRAFLLDYLGQVDPAAAALYARTILSSADSPDEWAVALRNLARGDASPEAKALLEAKTAELLRNEAWQQDPSVGYLEAFDTAVHLGGTNLLPALSDLVRKKDNPAVAHAAFLTLDRLTINQPAEMLAALAQHPEWMTGREETRANYFARADVSDAEQRRLVEAYLLDATRSPAELRAFAGVFPNANYLVSHNLLTEVATPDGTSLARRDQAALQAVNQWLADPRFEKVKPALLKMQARLAEFTRQAGPPN